MYTRVFIVSLVLFSCIIVVQSKSLLTCRNIRDVVNGHYQRRLQLAQGKVSNQPAASEMNDMIWDEELAAKAAKWASRNVFEHNPDNSVGSNRFRTGENLYWTASTDHSFKFDPNKALDSWFNEHKDFKYGPLTAGMFQSKTMIGHYTQMVWSDSVSVGCGLSSAQKNGMLNYYFVCNYGPGGNYLGQAPYPANGSASGHLTCSTGDCKKRYGDKC